MFALIRVVGSLHHLQKACHWDDEPLSPREGAAVIPQLLQGEPLTGGDCWEGRFWVSRTSTVRSARGAFDHIRLLPPQSLCFSCCPAHSGKMGVSQPMSIPWEGCSFFGWLVVYAAPAPASPSLPTAGEVVGRIMQQGFPRNLCRQMGLLGGLGWKVA